MIFTFFILLGKIGHELRKETYTMPGVKTAISLEKKLFDHVNKVAKEKYVFRSRLFILAVKDYLKKYENNELLAQINAACDDISSSEKEVKIVGILQNSIYTFYRI